MHVDDARGDPLAGGIDHAHAGGGLQRRADLDDPAVAHQHVGAVQALAGAGEHGGVAQQDRLGGQRLVGAGIGIVGEARGGRGRRRGGTGGRAEGEGRGGEQEVAHGFPRMELIPEPSRPACAVQCADRWAQAHAGHESPSAGRGGGCRGLAVRHADARGRDGDCGMLWADDTRRKNDDHDCQRGGAVLA